MHDENAEYGNFILKSIPFQSNQIVLSLSQASVKRPDSVQNHREADGDRVSLFLLED